MLEVSETSYPSLLRCPLVSCLTLSPPNLNTNLLVFDMQLRSKRSLAPAADGTPVAKRPKLQRASARTRTSDAERVNESEISSRGINDGSTGLLKLPGELRNAIYELALLGHPNNMITMNRSSTINQSSSDSPVPPLLQTCVQIRRESAPIHYQRHRFDLDTYGLNLLLRLTWSCDPAAHPPVWKPSLYARRLVHHDWYIAADEEKTIQSARSRVYLFIDRQRGDFSRSKLARLMFILHVYGKAAYERDLRLLARLRASLAALRQRAEDMQAMLSPPAAAPVPAPLTDSAIASVPAGA